MIKLLVVDDEPGLCAFLKRHYSASGFTVLTATSGQDALVLVEKEKPKIVFLDIRMLGMSGLDVLKRVKEAHKDMYVVMVTVLDDSATKQKAMELGADAFVTKPFTSEELDEIVRKKVAQILAEEKK